MDGGKRELSDSICAARETFVNFFKPGGSHSGSLFIAKNLPSLTVHTKVTSADGS